MSTEINIVIGGSDLRQRATEQTNANRFAKIESDSQKKALAKGRAERSKALNQQGKDPTGQPKPSTPAPVLRRDEPAAYRRSDFPNVSYAGYVGFDYLTQDPGNNTGTRDRKAIWKIYPFTNSSDQGQPYTETIVMANLPAQVSGNSVTISETTSGPQPVNIGSAGSVVSLLNDEPSKFPWTLTTTTETSWHQLFSEEVQANLTFPSKNAVFSAYGIGWFWYKVKLVRTVNLVYGASLIKDQSYYITRTSSVTEEITSSSGDGQDIRAWRWTAKPANAMLSFPSYADNSQVKEIACPEAVKSIIKDKYLPEFKNFSYTTSTLNYSDTTSFTWDGQSVATVQGVWTLGASYTYSVDPNWDYRAATRPVFYSSNPYYKSVGNRAITPGIYSVFSGAELPVELFKYYLLSELATSSLPFKYRWRLSKDGMNPIGSPRTEDEYTYIGSSTPAWDGGMGAYCTQQLTSLGFNTTTPAP